MTFEDEFPIPAGVRWNATGRRYESKDDHPLGLERAALQNARFDGWKAAQLQSQDSTAVKRIADDMEAAEPRPSETGYMWDASDCAEWIRENAHKYSVRRQDGEAVPEYLADLAYINGGRAGWNAAMSGDESFLDGLEYNRALAVEDRRQAVELPAVYTAEFETVDEETGITGTASAKVKRVEHQDDGAVTLILDHWPTMPIDGKYADVLIPFLQAMNAELHANAGKGDRSGWLQMTPDQAMLEIFYHASKLQKAMKPPYSPAEVREYAADVANMAMMALDISGGLMETDQ